jgi:histidinol-phosphate aminotransferase
LNANECPLPLPAAFSDDLASAVRDLPLNRYPDGEMRALREALAARAGHPIDGVWPANGSNEVLAQLLQAYGGPERSAAVFEPTYLLHRRLSWLTQTAIVERHLDPPFEISDEDVAWAREAAPDVVFVCSPNNPTGTIHPIDTIAALAASTDALVIVDEAYGDFAGEDALPLLADHANVAVVRTFSKSFALAGARIGYVLASPEVVDDLRRVRLPYHLSALTQAAASAALRHAPTMLRMVDEIVAQRDRIGATVEALGYTPYESWTNFVLFGGVDDPAATWQGLYDRGVLIRDVGIPHHLRVTAGTEGETTAFLDALASLESAS